MGEDHGNWEETGKAPTKILRYMGNGMYERCAPEPKTVMKQNIAKGRFLTSFKFVERVSVRECHED